jgi:chromate transporter
MIFFLQRTILNLRDKRKQQVIQYAAGALAVGLVLAAAWGIAVQINHSFAAHLLTIGTIAITFFTRWHPLYLIVIGGVLGVLGFI